MISMKLALFFLYSFPTFSLASQQADYHFKNTNIHLITSSQIVDSISGGGVSFLNGKVKLLASQINNHSIDKYLLNLKRTNVSFKKLKNITLDGYKGIFIEEKYNDKMHLKKVLQVNNDITIIELDCRTVDIKLCAPYTYLLDYLRFVE